MNCHPHFSYIVIKLKGRKRPIIIEKMYITNKKLFLDLLEKKVPIEKEKYWDVGKGEIEHPRRRVW